MSNELTDLQRVLLGALRGKGWQTRRNLADAIGRPTRLNPHDVEMLERLVKTGTVVKSQRIRPGTTVQQEYIYRFVE